MKNTFLKILHKIPKGLIISFLGFSHIIIKKISLFSTRLNLNTLQRPEVKQWDTVHGDETLRLDYPLNENSIVFDVGGFSGEWASPIFLRYMPHLYIFEPVKESIKMLKKKFGKNPKIKICEFGLSGNSGAANISTASHSASVFHDGKNGSEQIELRSIAEFMKKEKVEHIDLIKINIEGGEYDLLEHILDTGLVKVIDNIQVQFHDFVPNAEQRMEAIKARLVQTHYPTYQYRFVWENWKKKDA